ncbi:MAG: GntR family transcriptional regulator [candidate division WOR-3 bacterium]
MPATQKALESAVDHAAKFIERLIVVGAVGPGQKLREDEIAKKLNISRSPVREAMKLLEARGLVVRSPRKGVFVPPVTKKDIWEIYTLKMVLYTFATRLAAEKLDGLFLKKLDRIVTKMKKCVERHPPDVLRYQSLNDDFHLTIAVVSGHERLRKLIEDLAVQVHRYSYLSLKDHDHLRLSLSYHESILEALKNRDADKAESLTREHIMSGLRFLNDNETFTFKPTSEKEGLL